MQILDWHTEIAFGLVACYPLVGFYVDKIRTNHDTEQVNLMERYCKLLKLRDNHDKLRR